MLKIVLAFALAANVCVPPAVAESLLQRSAWQDRKFETYLPNPAPTVTWLAMPKSDIPIGRDANLRISTNVGPKSRSI